jgi:hypothetical protein
VLPTEAEVEAEAQKYMAMYPTADPEPGQPLRHTFFIPKVVDDLVSPHR